MMKYAPLLREFISQANTENLTNKKYALQESGIQSKASFGQGGKALIPWISFTKKGHTTANGIYPVYLYYRSQQVLILAYGISETNVPSINWNLKTPESVKDYFQKMEFDSPKRYGSSYVFKVYSPNNLPSDEILDKDLHDIMHIYDKTLNSKHLEVTKKTLKFDIDLFQNALKTANLVFTPDLVSRYIASLLSKRFVILTGLSGSGKTQLAKSFAHWISLNEYQYCIVPVGADWTNRDPLLGYPNGLKSDEYVLPETGVLQLLIRALEKPELPHFLILDEMNLSHVERYFADFLSVMESNETILLQNGEKSGVPEKIGLPKNVFITGTVNIDETTYMFSPKVLDRANVIEFRIESSEMETFLQSPVSATPIANTGRTMGQSFLEMVGQSIKNEATPQVAKVLHHFFDQLQQVGTEFGYRTATEIHRLMHFLEELGITDVNEKIDIAVMQKLLPKLHGSRRKLVPVLEVMAGFCLELPEGIKISDVLQGSAGLDIIPAYPLTLGKLKRMYRSAIDNGFASYAEA
jgi:5-methylcytosine-specific restriction protein B